jgi:hypothetical protein
MPNLFEYQNYRAYLPDYYTEQKAAKRNFSCRLFPKNAGIIASSLLFYVIEDKRDFTQTTAIKISQAIDYVREGAKGVSMRFHLGIDTLLSVAFVCAVTVSPMSAAPAYQGYAFFASGQTAYLIDPSGVQVHTWRATSSARSCAYLLADGSALFPIQTTCSVKGDGAYAHGRLQKISWEGQVVWDAVVCDATFTPGYDLEPMPNGNVLVAGATNTGGLKLVQTQPERDYGIKPTEHPGYAYGVKPMEAVRSADPR